MENMATMDGSTFLLYLPVPEPGPKTINHMRKKLLLLVLLVLVSVGHVHAARHYDFSAYSGFNVLYYRILTTNTVEVTYPYDTNAQNGYYGTTKPLGILEIGSTVTHDGRIYNVVSIGDYAFIHCTRIVSASIPNSVTHIGNNAFGSCTGLSSVDIPNSVTSIGEWAFANCTELSSVTIPNSVTNIGEFAFYLCSGLTSVSISQSVTSIAARSFERCTGLTTVTIPNSVTSIGYGAFMGCTGLTSVTIPNSVDSIGTWAFSCCTELSSVNIPNSVTYMGYHVFGGCSGINSPIYNNNLFVYLPTSYTGRYVIPHGITTICGGAFGKCNVTSISIPNTVTSIGYAAFALSNIKSISIPNSVTFLGGATLEETKITSIIIPDSVSSIPAYTFYKCTDLISVTIPNTVTLIDSNAFTYCISLNKIYSENPIAPQLRCFPFYGVSRNNISVYIPCGARESYTANWGSFNYIETPFFVRTNNTEQGTIEFIQEPTCDTLIAIVRAVPNEGYHFVRWSDGSTQNPYTYMPTAKSDMTLYAYFAPGEDTTGIEEVDGSVLVPNIYADGGRIVVTGAEGDDVYLYDMMGRRIATRQNCTATFNFDVPAAGIYLVRIGDRAARKVVVVR